MLLRVLTVFIYVVPMLMNVMTHARVCGDVLVSVATYDCKICDHDHARGVHAYKCATMLTTM